MADKPIKNRYNRPKFYPILPRVKREKRNLMTPHDRGNFTVKYNKEIHADHLNKLFNTYESDIYGVSSPVDVGTCTQTRTNNPGWRLAIAKGGNATFSYSREVISYKVSPYACKCENSIHKSFGSGRLLVGPFIEPADTTALADQAVAKLKNKLNGNIGKAQLAAPLAEGREIHRLVRQINTLGIDVVKAALAIRKTRGLSALKQFGDIWLGFGFGVKPMLKDIESAANAILDYTTREDRHVRIVGTARREYRSFRKDGAFEEIAWGLKVGYYNRVVHKQGFQIVAGIDLKLRSAASYSVTDHLGLEISQAPSVLWELTPFSWVVDYFVTVGPWLEDMFYTLPGTTKYVSQATKYQSETTTDLYAQPNAGYSGGVSGGRSTVNYVSFTRQSLSSLPSRAVRVKSFDEIASNGVTKLLNLASVLAQKRGPNLT
jgi:hypothetical protein